MVLSLREPQVTAETKLDGQSRREVKLIVKGKERREGAKKEKLEILRCSEEGEAAAEKDGLGRTPCTSGSCCGAA